MYERSLQMEWISIEQKLPHDGQRVLLYTPYPFFGSDYSCIGDRESISTCTINEGTHRSPIFTHWMPLPPGPSSAGKITKALY
jgi:hypothetical protein